MSDLRPRGIAVNLDGVERHFLFTLNLIDEIQDKYDKNLRDVILDLADEDVSGHTLRNLVADLINDEAERAERSGSFELTRVTEHEVGEMIGLDNYYVVMAKVFEAYGISLPDLEEEDPNQKSGQQSN